jgi:YD repeat-containing protein
VTEGIAPTPAGIPRAERREARAYDPAGNLKSVTRGLTTADNATHQSVSFPATPVPHQHVTTVAYDYDALNRVTAVYEGGPGSSSFLRGSTLAYDRAGNLRWETTGLASDPAARNPVTARHGYDLRGRPAQVIEAAKDSKLERTTTTVYDAVGNVWRVEDPLGRVTSYGYDALDRLERVTEAFGTTFARDTKTKYDPAGNVWWTEDPRGTITSFAYDRVNRPVEVIEASNDPSVRRTTTMLYDRVGNVIGVWSPRPSDGQAGAASHVLTSYVYDKADRRTEVRAAVGEDFALTHNPPIATTAYDKVGNVLSVTDPLGRVTSYAYDSLDRPVWELEDWRPDGMVGRATYRWYDAADNLVRTETGKTSFFMTYAPRVVAATYAYDAVNRPTSATEAAQALGPGWDGQPAPRLETRWAYDAADNPTRVTDPNGVATVREYDRLGRPAQQFEAKDTPVQRTTTYAYDQVDRLLSEEHQRLHADSPDDGLGQTVTTSYGYDPLDRLGRVVEAFGTTFARDTKTGYDKADNVVWVTDPLDRKTEYGYDKLNRLETVREAPGDLLFMRTSTFVYDAADNLIREIQPRIYDWEQGSYQSGLGYVPPDLVPETVHTYDPLGRVRTTTRAANVSQVVLGHPLAVTSYEYDAAGRLTWEWGPPRGPTNQSLAALYEYDRLDNLVRIDQGKLESDVFTSLRYDTQEYDSLGRLGKHVHGLVQGTPQVGGATHVQREGTMTYAYDPAGRLVREAVAVDYAGLSLFTEYEYDKNGNVELVRERPSTYAPLPNPLPPDLIGVTVDRWQFLQRRETKYDYDKLNRLTAETKGYAPAEFAAFNQTKLGHPAPVTRYQYNAVDDLIKLTDPRQVAATFGYDPFGNRVREALAAESPVVSTAGMAKPVTTYAYNKADQLIRVTDPVGVVTEVDYDPLGRPNLVTEAVGRPGERSTATKYDAAGQPVEVTRGLAANAELQVGVNTYPYQHKITTSYAYDALGRLDKVTEGVQASGSFGQAQPWSQHKYDAAGNLIRVTTNVGRPNQAQVSVTRYEYDELFRPIRTVEGETAGGDPAAARVTTAQFDSSDNLIQSVGPDGVKTAYVYDTDFL